MSGKSETSTHEIKHGGLSLIPERQNILTNNLRCITDGTLDKFYLVFVSILASVSLALKHLKF